MTISVQEEPLATSLTQGVGSAPRSDPSIDLDRAVSAVAELLRALALDPEGETFRRTPERVAETFGELCAGVNRDAGVPLHGGEVNVNGDISISLRDLSFRSLCPHHLLPYSGNIEISYIPGPRILGIGSFARAVGILAARPQLQEDLTRELAELIHARVHAIYVEVTVIARHPCIADRGPLEARAVVETRACAGKSPSL